MPPLGVARSLCVLVAATVTGCEGCEGGPGVAIYRVDGTPLDRVPGASSGGDPAEAPYELHLCPGAVETVIASLYTGCGGQCFEPSRVERLATSSRALHVAIAGTPITDQEELRFGHLLAIDAGEPGGLLGVVLEGTEADGRVAAHAEVAIIVDRCAP